MSDRLQWLLELQDRLSGPAEKIEKQLGRVRAQLKKLDIDAKTNALDKITDPLKKQRAELQLHRDKLLLSKGAMEKHGNASKWLGERLKAGREALRDWLLILDPVARGLHFVAERAAEMGKRIIAAVSFKQRSMIGLEAMFGGKGGDDVFERMERMAGQIGKPIEQVVGLARSLAAVGFKQADLEPMVRLIEDLDALDPGAGDKLASVLRGVKSTGFAGVGDVEALRGTMLSPDKFYEKYSRSMGGPGNRIAGKAALEQLGSVGSGIPPNLFTSMLLGGVLDLEGGKAGSASGRDTTQSLIDRVGIQIERMFGRLSKSGGVKAFSSVMLNLVKVFDPDSASGQRIFARLQDLSAVIGKTLEPLTGRDGLKRMEDFFTRLVALTKGAMPAVMQLGRGIEYLMKRFAPLDADKKADMAASLVDHPGLVPFESSRGVISREEMFGLPGGEALTAAMRQREEISREVFARDASPMSRANWGLRGAEVNVTVQVDARGASKDDAEHIAEKVKGSAIDAVTEALDRAATQQGAQ